MSKQGKKPRPEQTMTKEEATALASIVAFQLIDANDNALEAFLLLLRFFAYRSTPDDAEAVYIGTEEEYATHFEGVEEAIGDDLAKRLADLGRAKKGGA